MSNRTARCYAHRHLSPPEYGLYVLLRELSSSNSYKYHFDDRTLAKRFVEGRGVSRQTINRLRRSLERKRFIQWETDLTRVNGGGYESRVGKILSHDEWAAKNPGQCHPVHTGKHLQCSQAGSSVLTDERNQCSPVGHKKNRSSSTEIEASRCPAPAPPPSAVSADLLKSDSDGPCLPASIGNSEQCSPVSISGTESVAVLEQLAEAHVSVRQRTDEIPNLNLVTKLSADQARLAFEGAIADPFWDVKLSGASALRTFCKHLPTILKQQRSSAARQKQRTLPKHKAASVAPPSSGFAYVGEII